MALVPQKIAFLEVHSLTTFIFAVFLASLLGVLKDGLLNSLAAVGVSLVSKDGEPVSVVFILLSYHHVNRLV